MPDTMLVTTIGRASAREKVTVRGTVSSIQVEPHDAAPRLTARIDDGSGAMDAVFLGRREIAEVAPGAVLTLTGVTAEGPARMRMVNPWIEQR